MGTDLVQAVPLVIAAAMEHILYGDVDWGLVWPLTVGSIPGALIDAQLSSRASGTIVRRALAVVLLAPALKMLNVSNELTVPAVVFALIVGTIGWMIVRVRHGLQSTQRQQRRASIRSEEA